MDNKLSRAGDAESPVCRYFLGLGGNLPSTVGAPDVTVRHAADRLAAESVSPVRLSPLYGARPVPPSGQPDFVNAVLELSTRLAPQALLERVKALEVELGRRPGQRWSARPIDIDLLAMEGAVVPDRAGWQAVVDDADPAAFTEAVMLPHPRLHVRRFVLMPLCDLAPGWEHPCLDMCADALLASLPAVGDDVWPLTSGVSCL